MAKKTEPINHMQLIYRINNRNRTGYGVSPYPVRFLICLFLFATSSFAQEPTKLSWHTEETTAKQEAAKTGKPIFLYFTADWCHYCVQMEDETLHQSEVQTYLKKQFILFKVDYDANKDLVARYRIRGVPAMVAGNPTLEITEQASGFMPETMFLPWIKKAEKAISPEAIAAKLAAETKYFTETKRNFRKGLTSQQYESIRQFFDQVRRKEPLAIQFAENDLVDEVKHNPARFSRFLSDDKLHTRILVTNAFAKIYGTEFTYDPWDQTETNQEQLKEYLKQKNISSLLEDLIDF